MQFNCYFPDTQTRSYRSDWSAWTTEAVGKYWPWRIR